MSPSKFSRKQLLALVALNLALIAGLAAFSARTLVAERHNRFDFYPHWVGGRAVWSGETPYQPAVTQRIQAGMFGGRLPASEDQQRFAYPAYTSVALGPLLALPAPAAIAIWTALQLWAVLATPFVWLVITGWRPRPWQLAALLVGLVLVFRYPMIVFVLGQFTGTMLLLISLGVLLLLRGRDGWAGAAFALACSPPTLAGPLALAILGAYALKGRWRPLLAFAATLGLLCLVSFALIGWWLPGFIEVLFAYSQYSGFVWPPGLLGSPAAAGLLAAGVLAWLGARLRAFVRSGQEAAAALQFVLAALVVALLLLPQTGSYYLTLLIPVLFVAASRLPVLAGWPRAAVAGLLALAIASPWLYYDLGAGQSVESLLLPLHAGLLIELTLSAAGKAS